MPLAISTHGRTTTQWVKLFRILAAAAITGGYVREEKRSTYFRRLQQRLAVTLQKGNCHVLINHVRNARESFHRFGLRPTRVTIAARNARRRAFDAAARRSAAQATAEATARARAIASRDVRREADELLQQIADAGLSVSVPVS